MNINLQNIEELILFNRQVRNLLPDFKNQFGQWDLSRYSPGLRPLGKRALLDILNGLTPEHLEVLQAHFKEPVTLLKLDQQIVKHSYFELADAEDRLNELGEDDWVGQIVIYRDADRLYVSNWR